MINQSTNQYTNAIKSWTVWNDQLNNGLNGQQINWISDRANEPKPLGFSIISLKGLFHEIEGVPCYTTLESSL